MGLDVFLVRTDGARISWNDPIMQNENGFPFDQYEETYDEEDPYSDEPVGQSSQWRIAEICGMYCIGDVSFQGRGYRYFAIEEELPYSFISDLTPAQLQEQSVALARWLEQHTDAPEDDLHHGESMRSLRNLSTLLKWAVEHGLGTEASN